MTVVLINHIKQDYKANQLISAFDVFINSLES